MSIQPVYVSIQPVYRLICVFLLLEFDLGIRLHTGKAIDEVELPKWAHGPDDFIQKHRQALVRY